MLRLRGLGGKCPQDDDLVATIVGILFQKLQADLRDAPVELLALNPSGRLPGQSCRLPLLVRTRALQEVADFALSFVLQLLDGAKEEVAAQLRGAPGLDGDEETWGDLARVASLGRGWRGRSK